MNGKQTFSIFMEGIKLIVAIYEICKTGRKRRK